MKLFLEKDKEERLFREIMGRYKQKVYWQARRIVLLHDDADEVVQNVFIKLWKNAESFRFDSALSSFIYRIAYNESITLLKQKQRFSSLDDIADQDGQLKRVVHGEFGMSGDKILLLLQEALLSLPEKQRLVFNYKYFEELQYKEISEITGTSEGALKANYHFAVEKIKKYLDKF
ncbi:MAG: RNA polymerase sigma factor [Bacteroidia bacterium]|nr:RNA polymerase sigma factor [Bacteroidia bacterium]